MSRLFGWYYPPGVTGNEYEIAGADYEKELDTPCPKCGENTLMEEGYRGNRWESCSECDYYEDLEPLVKEDFSTEDYS